MNNSYMQQHTFTVKSGSTELSFVIDIDKKTGKPIKIGDGTYGVVFSCTSLEDECIEGDACAVKLFYETENQSEIAKGRYEDEIKAGILIKDKLKITADPTAFKYVGVVEIRGGTTQFKKSPAYKSFQTSFENLRISNYALVTTRFKFTLKQLLEEQNACYIIKPDANTKSYGLNNESIPFCRTRKELENFIDKVKIDGVLSNAERSELKSNIEKKFFTGYDILRNLDFDLRIRCILPFLEDIAQGLKTLHEANFLHLDVKTANIFVRDYANQFQSVIGDLGFLKPQDYALFKEPPTVPGASSDFPLGTRHYRSPEQKDFFDVADAHLIVDQSELKVSISDPKFRDTIIRAGDFVYISKFHHAFKILDICITENESKPVVLSLDTNKNTHLLESDIRTQVVFYKLQKYQTDLFGFGAITFDLLTCGKSPERFYELIKGLDHKGVKVDDVIERYVQVSSFRSGDSNLSDLFSSFRLHKNSPSYAPREIVELILKCMLYKASGTFYDSRYKESPALIMGKVLSAIRELSQKYSPITLSEKNYLYGKIFLVENAVSEDSGVSFQNNLLNLQKIPRDKVVLRIVYGIQQLEKIVELVRNSLKSSENFLSELNPRNIEIFPESSGKSLKFKTCLYKSKESYLESIKQDLLYTKISADLRDEYTPHFFEFIRRKIWLKKTAKVDTFSKGLKSSKLDWEYAFQGASLYGDRIKESDWIVYKSQEQEFNTLYQIVAIDRNSKTLTLEEVSSSINSYKTFGAASNGLTKGSQGANAFYYENIDPITYYLQVIGIYIYKIFFAELNSSEDDNLIFNVLTSLNSPQIFADVKILNGKRNADVNGNFGFSSFLKNQKRNKEMQNCLSEICDLLILIYLKSFFSNSPNSYWGMQASINPISALRSDIENLKRLVPPLVNPKFTSWQLLDDVTDSQLEENIKKFSSLYSCESFFQFYELACSRLSVDLTPQGIFLKKLLE